MGVAAPFIPYIAAAAAAGAQYYNTRQTGKRQDEALAAGIRQQSKTQRKADERVQQTIGEIAGSSPADATAAAREGYQQAVRGTDQMAASGQALSGLSEAYDQAARAANTTAAGRTGAVADLLSRIDAPLQQRQSEGFRVGDLGTDLSILKRTSQGQDFLSRLKAQGVRRNPWIDAFSAGLQGYASAGAGGAEPQTAFGPGVI